MYTCNLCVLATNLRVLIMVEK